MLWGAVALWPGRNDRPICIELPPVDARTGATLRKKADGTYAGKILYSGRVGDEPGAMVQWDGLGEVWTSDRELAASYTETPPPVPVLPYNGTKLIPHGQTEPVAQNPAPIWLSLAAAKARWQFQRPKDEVILLPVTKELHYRSIMRGWILAPATVPAMLPLLRSLALLCTLFLLSPIHAAESEMRADRRQMMDGAAQEFDTAGQPGMDDIRMRLRLPQTWTLQKSAKATEFGGFEREGKNSTIACYCA